MLRRSDTTRVLTDLKIAVMSPRQSSADPRFVLITPAFNEERFLPETIASVLNQSLKPDRWLIVDDGSKDRTAEVVRSFQRSCGIVELAVRQKAGGDTYYSSNVLAIRQAYEQLKGQSFDFVAILDADMVLPVDYYSEILKRMTNDPLLGIATGVYSERDSKGTWRQVRIDRLATPKALQVFRRKCYEDIGGYIACKNGGEDTCAEITARMLGWRTRSFPEIATFHRRTAGTGVQTGTLGARFRLGVREYSVATHPVFMVAKCFRRCFVERPWILSGLARFCGYGRAWIAQTERQLPAAAVHYVRGEQMRRLGAAVTGRLNRSREKYEGGAKPPTVEELQTLAASTFLRAKELAGQLWSGKAAG